MSLQCEQCDKMYQHRDALIKHMRQKHNFIYFKQSKKLYECFHCGSRMSVKNDLVSHLKTHKSHNTSISRKRKSRIICPLCVHPNVNYQGLRKHLEQTHQCQIEQNNLEFQHMTEFTNWKLKIENEHSSMYVQDTAEKTLKNGEKKSYYVCHRSYEPRLITSSKRKLKNGGTNKFQRACPSLITVTKYSDKINVIFYSTHVGHSCDLDRVKLNYVDRNKIAGKLAEGVTIQKILEDVRESASHDNFQRIHLLEKKDLYNIKRDFSIGCPMKRHESDAINVKLWVAENKKGRSNSILYFKEQGEECEGFKKEDFFLAIMTEFQEQQLKLFGHKKICIYGTYGLNGYDFQLYTIVIVDEYGCGIPASFCFSNRDDIDVFRFFFQCIKNRVGSIKTTVFMSDDAPAFYNAWVDIMGTVPNRLLCSWHVLKNWTQNVDKIKCPEKRKYVLKTLKTLQTETDKETFVLESAEFIKDLSDDVDTQEFGKYFMVHYSNRSENWAYCFRNHLDINTNMYLESLHQVIEHHYLEGKRCKRLDKTLNALMNLVRDKMFEKIKKYTASTEEDQEIQSKLEYLTGLQQNSNLDEDKKNKVIKHLDAVISLMSESTKSKHTTGISVNVNKKVEKQGRYFSTRNKKKSKWS